MNSDLVHSIVQMEPSILKNWMTEVKETVATDVVLPGAGKSPAFSALKLWDIRRNRRYSAHTRKQPRIVTGFGY